ncbi:translation initiation factor IF-2 [Streptomyces sp. NPDC006288]|uniref:translation initiation factor IF-2 n=1 Tax=Streptomyces sp. NPDC006288 TaxID=3156743 RepID=UPI0033B53C4A
MLTAGCTVAQSAEDEATDAAREVAAGASDRLYGRRPCTAEEVGRSASGIDGVEVLRVTGTSTHDGDGVDLVVRTSGSAHRGWIDTQEVTVERCFGIRVSPRSQWREDPKDADCPDGPPPAFAQTPEPPRLPEGGRVDEAEVRRGVAALDLPPEIRTEVKAEGGRVGVLLYVRGNGFDAQDCPLGRVGPGSTDVRVPPRVQRMPGEGGCGVGNTLDPAASPH